MHAHVRCYPGASEGAGVVDGGGSGDAGGGAVGSSGTVLFSTDGIRGKGGWGVEEESVCMRVWPRCLGPACRRTVRPPHPVPAASQTR